MQLLDILTAVAACEKPKDHLDIKENKSSNASLLMNPVASGDNVALGLASGHRVKEELPPLVPCCEGRELRINEDLVRSGLSAISVKHDSVIQCLSSSRASERSPAPGLVKHRNSYRCLHRPDLKRVPCLRMLTPDELEMLFRGHSDFPRTLWSNNQDNAPRALPPDENILNRDLRTKESDLTDENGVSLHPILEVRSSAVDLPAGMRLHGTRGRLSTSVRARARAGDQLTSDSVSDDLDTAVEGDIEPEVEVQLTGDLQILLPPRCNDVTTESSATSNATASSSRS